jgi:YtkA-like protein
MSRSLAHAGAALALLLAGAGCGSSSGDADPGDTGETVSCQMDPRLDAYTGSLDKAGELGLLSFHFSDLEPSPPAKGLNVFHVRVNDGAGAPMQGALGVDLYMPDHGHGTSVEPIIDTGEPGTFTVRQMFLFMPGVWRISFDAFSGDAEDAPELDSVRLYFCVEG